VLKGGKVSADMVTAVARSGSSSADASNALITLLRTPASAAVMKAKHIDAAAK
jgi:hypothetical protein